jgi:hypothetical protein
MQQLRRLLFGARLSTRHHEELQLAASIEDSPVVHPAIRSETCLKLMARADFHSDRLPALADLE